MDWEVLYASASFNDRMLGHGEPIRVRQGQRVLFRLVNASPTENVTMALAGHRLPSSPSMEILCLRDEAWIRCFSLRQSGRHDCGHETGLGSGSLAPSRMTTARWASVSWLSTPARAVRRNGRRRPLHVGLHDLWRRTAGRRAGRTLEFVFEKIPGGRGGYNRWALNGSSWPATNPLFTTERGKRYRVVMATRAATITPFISIAILSR